MDIDDIYTVSNARRLATSRQFSRQFLGRVSDYLANTGEGQGSAATLVHLSQNLQEFGQPDLQMTVLNRLLNGVTLPRAGERP